MPLFSGAEPEAIAWANRVKATHIAGVLVNAVVCVLVKESTIHPAYDGGAQIFARSF